MKRKEGESYEEFKTRRKLEQIKDDRHLMGQYVWFSRIGEGKGQTFEKVK